MHRHSRRQLLQGSVALAVFTLLSRREVAGQQTAKIPRIGFLAVGSRQIVIEYRFSEGRNDRLPAFPVE